MPSAPRESCSAHECTPKDAHESCSRCGRWGAASNESMPTGQLYARPSAQVTQQMGVYESQQWARGALVDLAGAPHYLRSFWHRGLPCCGRPPCSKGYDQCRPCGPGRVEEKGRDWAERERSRRVKSRRLDLRRVGRALGSILGFVDQESGRPTALLVTRRGPIPSRACCGLVPWSIRPTPTGCTAGRAWIERGKGWAPSIERSPLPPRPS